MTSPSVKRRSVGLRRRSRSIFLTYTSILLSLHSLAFHAFDLLSENTIFGELPDLECDLLVRREPEARCVLFLLYQLIAA